jgi:PIN domain nuclease of toxin-antitoxin system
MNGKYDVDCRKRKMDDLLKTGDRKYGLWIGEHYCFAIAQRLHSGSNISLL